MNDSSPAVQVVYLSVTLSWSGISRIPRGLLTPLQSPSRASYPSLTHSLTQSLPYSLAPSLTPLHPPPGSFTTLLTHTHTWSANEYSTVDTPLISSGFDVGSFQFLNSSSSKSYTTRATAVCKHRINSIFVENHLQPNYSNQQPGTAVRTL